MTRAKKTILVVEDDDSRRKALVALLSDAGYDVIAGEDFQSALHMVDRLGVDVMISDLQLSAAPTRPAAAPATHSKQRPKHAPKQLFVSRVPVPGGQAAAPGGDILPLPLDRTVLLDKVRALLS
jgi:CheY-like chemotaxis protein